MRILATLLLLTMSTITLADDTSNDTGIRFKTEKIKIEFFKLQAKNPMLAIQVGRLQAFSAKNFNKDIVLTHLFRSQADQYRIYGAGYKKRSWHQFWKGVDIRSNHYTVEEKDSVQKFLNTLGLERVLRHDIGLGDHFHIEERDGRINQERTN